MGEVVVEDRLLAPELLVRDLRAVVMATAAGVQAVALLVLPVA
jgi:hypothetical protein